jgi:hypothetical protein
MQRARSIGTYDGVFRVAETVALCSVNVTRRCGT